MQQMKPRVLVVWAIGYAALCVALGVTVSEYFYLALVPLLVARPLLRELGFVADSDERQRQVSYRSSHVAFLVAMSIAGVAFAKAIIDDAEPAFEVCVILFVGLLVKFAGLVLQAKARRIAGMAIAWVIGGAWLLFSLASHGLSVASLMESIPWLAVFACAIASRKWPKVGGAGLVLIGLGTLWFFVLGSAQPVGAKALVAALIPAPLILAGVLVLTGGGDWREEA
jgi:hypothetical protein